MTELVLEVPEELFLMLKRRAELEGKAFEELVDEAILDYLGVSDPEVKAEIHIKLCEKYLREGEELLARNDHAQASEKFWGAASQMVKTLAARRGVELRSYSELHSFIVELARGSGDPGIRMLWQSAGMLHQNFYENWLPPEMVEENASDVKKLIEKLRSLLKLIEVKGMPPLIRP